MNTLKIARRVLATLSFVAMTLLILDFTGAIRLWAGWLAQIQFLPALLAINIAAVAFVVILTLLIGRIYCSIICPLGIMQDGIAWIRRRFNRHPYRYSLAKTWLRIAVLILFVAGMLASVKAITFLAPYSTFSRMVTTLLQPVYIAANNILADWSTAADNYMFYRHDYAWYPVSLIGIVLVHLVVIITLAWRNGRTYCNTICPVGTLLGYIAPLSIFKIRIDANKCKNCGKCARTCKAACIDFKEHDVDYSRCVMCGSCLDECSFGALQLVGGRKSSQTATDTQNKDNAPVDTSRRSFLIGAAVATSTAAMAQAKKKVDGGLAAIEEKVVPQRHTPIIPAGSLSAQNMANHCTTCQLCISECPNHVLRPSTDMATFMMPVMSYERGYCRPECTRCADVCPTGAIHKITAEEKTAIHIGHAVWVRDNCLPLTEGVTCGNCSRHCPAGAIDMVPSDPNDEQSVRIPAVNESLCIGCGACENLCPARPLSAIIVEGNEVHIED